MNWNDSENRTRKWITDERSLYIAHTLIHMPSPETIRVLGNYLCDERDIPPERNWTPENAHLAAYALSRIGVPVFPSRARWCPIV